ncbi:MAG: hypothetical protein KGO93_07325 [Cyanobacteria bacterium REEB446]|nr:hypothetical protein [Cyanobacteria bacterium REEB446]
MTGSVSRTKFKALESEAGTPSIPSSEREAASFASSLARSELLARFNSGFTCPDGDGVTLC